MSNKKSKKLSVFGWSVAAAALAVLTAVFIAGTVIASGFETVINIALHADSYKIVKGKGSENENVDYFSLDYSSVEELERHDKEIAEQLSAEGCVLLRNNGVLPLAKGTKVSCFSQSSVDVVTCGGGSAEIDCDGEENKLYAALTAAELDVNKTLWDFYNTGAGKNYRRITGGDTYQVNEVPLDLYTDEVTASFRSYNGAAIVVISRKGAEFSDMAMGNYADGTNVLALNEAEKAMMRAITDSFDKVIVLLNTANPMEMGFLDEYDVDACLWMGYAGRYGLNAVADILVGNVNPSGRLVDTYCYDNTAAPANEGFYGADFTNANEENAPVYTGAAPGWFYVQLDGNKHYNCYQEGVYVGYRYYETRYEDAVLDRGNASSASVGATTDTADGWDYGREVAYPFGYGLSYTEFVWSEFDCRAAEDKFEISVTVKNIGGVAGKDVVEIYFQSPYTTGGAEKAAIELCGFGKTRLLQPNEEQTLIIPVDREELAFYDAESTKSYVVDGGNYYFTAARNAHEAINNVLAAKNASGMDDSGNVNFVKTFTLERDTSTYSKSSVTGMPITNRFEKADGKAYGLNIGYLSRNDWTGTWPDAPVLTATDEMMRDLCLFDTYRTDSADKTEMPQTGKKNGLTLAMYKGKNFNDSTWDALLDQCTFEEMALLIGKTYHNTAVMTSVSKPATLDDNGPQGFTQALSGVKTCRCAYTDECVMAATWNTELMKEVGRCIGNDMLSLSNETTRISGLYGPAMNIHRSAYGGRNFEYYSEDGFLSGEIAAAEIQGIQSKGIYAYIKHFALNDQETQCRCISTFAPEQAIREIYLKPFQTAVVKGNAHAVMNAFARFGCTWSGAHRGLMTDVLRGEWGFDGFAVTDYNLYGSQNIGGNAMTVTCYSFDIASALLAGTDGYDCSTDGWKDMLQKYKSDPKIVSAMRQASKRILYTVVNSAAMNGISPRDRVVAVMPWWEITLVTVSTVLGALALVCLFTAVYKAVKRN